MGATVNQFSAAGSALGYVAQVEYGLLLMLQRMDQDPDLAVSLETTDDIVFEDAARHTPLELWQTKHHVGSRGSLGDASPDLWKTLHNWIVAPVDGVGARMLMSTRKAPPSSAAAALRDSGPARDPSRAHQLLLDVAQAGGNAAHESYYEAFLGISKVARIQLLSTVYVIDQTVTAAGLTDALKDAVRKSAPAQRREALIERLRGWWLGRTCTHLEAITDGLRDSISMDELEDRLHYIRESLRDDTLPIDFGDVPEPTQEEVAVDDRIFVDQLRLIAWHSLRIRHAVFDHNRAFLQRSKWQRERLVNIGELAIYDQRLIDEWRRHFLPVADTQEPETTAEEILKEQARNALLRLETSDLPEVRSALRSGCIPIGSLHMLADQMKIGWHRDWLEHLHHRLSEAASAVGAEA